MMLMRRAVVVAVAALGAVGTSAVRDAGAQSPPPTVGFLLADPSPVRNLGPTTITPSDPCPPPSAATQPFAVVNDLGTDAAGGKPVRLASVPVAADGTWSARVSLSGAGWHGVDAFCLSGPQAEGAYDSYEPSVVFVLTGSQGFWAASSGREAPAVAGDAPDYTAIGGEPVGPAPRGVPAAPVVAVAADPTSGLGYWTLSSDGGVYTFGHTQFWGSAGDVHLAAPAVGLAVTPTGHGYWIAAADGGVFTYGDARYYGSGAGGPDRSPVVGIARTGRTSALGYLLAHADGAVFAYTAGGVSELNGPRPLAAPVVGIASTPSENGYWLAASDGGVFSFGDAGFAGSLGGVRLAAPITGITARADGGYWLVGRDGGVFAFGGAPFVGSFAGSGLRFTAIAATPDPTA